ncbi:MAG: hypothetical protein HKP41_01755 [Desulfobacterales bacterium]|nr:hypothetical protein [Deltaproteobacteria bacterium]MBT8360052.1 hypothetical protein [Deltaproteobacteria bacterium]NNK93053.1 hypothetical protein [Desulfobacterales bacterium]
MISNRLLLICACAGFLLMGAGVTTPEAWADDSFEEMSTEERLFVRGLVSSVNIQDMVISVRPLKGKRIPIQLIPETILEGVSGIDKFEKKQQVKVWYIIEDNENRAIKIKKMMELGC